jgi:hypothetical protein
VSNDSSAMSAAKSYLLLRAILATAWRMVSFRSIPAGCDVSGWSAPSNGRSLAQS